MSKHSSKNPYKSVIYNYRDLSKGIFQTLLPIKKRVEVLMSVEMSVFFYEKGAILEVEV